jgi:enoyl-CoA hydratase/carnithine racemase
LAWPWWPISGVASPDARFTANFVKLGFHPGFGITHTLPRLVGAARAELMCLTGRRVKPRRAFPGVWWTRWSRWRSCARPPSPSRARSPRNAPLALIATRKTLRGDLAAAVRAQTDIEFREQSILRETDDFKEGVRSVAERRAGNFTGR